MPQCCAAVVCYSKAHVFEFEMGEGMGHVLFCSQPRMCSVSFSVSTQLITYFLFCYKSWNLTTSYLWPIISYVWLRGKKCVSRKEGKQMSCLVLGIFFSFLSIYYIMVCMFPALINLSISILLNILLLLWQHIRTVRPQPVVNLHSYGKLYHGPLFILCMNRCFSILRLY